MACFAPHQLLLLLLLLELLGELRRPRLSFFSIFSCFFTCDFVYACCVVWLLNLESGYTPYRPYTKQGPELEAHTSNL